MSYLETAFGHVSLVGNAYKELTCTRAWESNGFGQALDVVVGVHQGSVLSQPLLIIVLEAPSREFHTAAVHGSCCIQNT